MQVQPGETEEEEKQASFFVTISWHSGFRRLHRVGCCSTQPWACHKVEYLSRVTENIADAVCKTCKKAGGSMEEDRESSSSGSSSSTDAGVVDELEEELGALEG
eukprot:s4108_g13.t1